MKLSRLYNSYEAALTKRKIHDASDMEPKTPESASCAVSSRCGLLCAIMADQCMMLAFRTTSVECSPRLFRVDKDLRCRNSKRYDARPGRETTERIPDKGRCRVGE